MATIDDNPTPWHGIGSREDLRLQNSLNRTMGSRSVDRNHDCVGAVAQDPVGIMRGNHDESPLS